MLIKHTKKIRVLSYALVIALSLFPTVSRAGFFDWLKNPISDSVPANNSPLFQSSYLYAHASFSDFQKESHSLWAVAFQGNAIVQPSSLLTVVDDDTDEKVVNKIMRVRLTAYSSTPDQTDSSPLITAKGTRVRDGIVAANFLPFNTLIKIPELYGNKVFVVEDRMHARFQSTVDIWFPDRGSALRFGKKTAEIEIVSAM